MDFFKMDEFKIEKDGFEIVRNFTSNHEVQRLRAMALNEYLTRALPYDSSNILKMPLTKYPPLVNETINDLFLRIAEERHEIIHPEKDIEECKTIFHQRRYWCRFMWYGWINEHDGFSRIEPQAGASTEYKDLAEKSRLSCTLAPHTDSEEEIMAILFLTEPGVDYEGGLRVFNKDGSETNVDSYCHMGDLALVRGNIPHYVDIKINKPALKGRLTFFVNYDPYSEEGIQFSSLEEAREHARH